MLTIETLEQCVKFSSQLTIKTPERRKWCTYFTPSSVSIVNFEHVIAGWERTYPETNVKTNISQKQ